MNERKTLTTIFKNKRERERETASSREREREGERERAMYGAINAQRCLVWSQKTLL